VCELLVESVVKMQTWEHIRRIENLACPDGLAVQRQVSFYELSVYMHDQLLRDTDQMSMAHGLEVRVPLIGRKVVEAVAGLGHGALAGNRPKAVLRRILSKYLPGKRFRGPKQGFTLNWADLLVAHDLHSMPSASGLFHQSRVEQIRRQFRNRRTKFGPVLAISAVEACGRSLSRPI
jgi:hypothetical protein